MVSINEITNHVVFPQIGGGIATFNLLRATHTIRDRWGMVVLVLLRLEEVTGYTKVLIVLLVARTGLSNVRF